MNETVTTVIFVLSEIHKFQFISFFYIRELRFFPTTFVIQVKQSFWLCVCLCLKSKIGTKWALTDLVDLFGILTMLSLSVEVKGSGLGRNVSPFRYECTLWDDTYTFWIARAFYTAENALFVELCVKVVGMKSSEDFPVFCSDRFYSDSRHPITVQKDLSPITWMQSELVTLWCI